MNSDGIFESRKIKLVVPYNDVSKIRSMGAKPFYKDSEFVCWYVPDGIELSQFRNWWSGSFVHEYNVKNNIAHTLTDYLRYVSDVFEKSFSYSEWVVCNVNSITVRNYASIDISDYDNSGNESSKTRAVIYGKKMSLLNRFKSVTGMPLASGHKVMIKISPSFNEKYGVSFEVEDIQPEFTIGDMEAKLNKIRDSLKSSGSYTKNKYLRFPSMIQNVAVISPDNAAGLGDFMTIANTLEQNELCEFSYFSAFFQGDKLNSSFNRAISDLIINHEKNPFDLVCVIRGGGDKAGLDHLNNLELAESIANLGIPLIVGIGHEKDATILDEISNTRMPTPSMCISYIKDHIFSDYDLLTGIISNITSSFDAIELSESSFLEQSEMIFSNAIESFLNNEVKEIDFISERLFKAIDVEVDNEKESLGLQVISFNDNIDAILDVETMDIRQLYSFAMANNPLALLERGYSLCNQNGCNINSIKDIKDGETEIIFPDGLIVGELKIINRKENER